MGRDEKLTAAGKSASCFRPGREGNAAWSPHHGTGRATRGVTPVYCPQHAGAFSPPCRGGEVAPFSGPGQEVTGGAGHACRRVGYCPHDRESAYRWQTWQRGLPLSAREYKTRACARQHLCHRPSSVGKGGYSWQGWVALATVDLPRRREIVRRPSPVFCTHETVPAQVVRRWRSRQVSRCQSGPDQSAGYICRKGASHSRPKTSPRYVNCSLRGGSLLLPFRCKTQDGVSTLCG
jgi:hypothetical protein